MLRVVLHSPLRHIREKFEKCRTLGSEDAMDGFVHMRKAHCMFGWDWGAHLPDAGIFRDVSLVGIKGARLGSVYIRQEHRKESVVLHVQAEEDAAALFEKDGYGKAGYRKEIPVREDISYSVEITAPDGTVQRYPDSPKEIPISRPMLWWPNGYGEQPLYTVKVILFANEIGRAHV